eukprot:366196-Chlamydomonas_euryale.AAC.15
MSAAVHVRLMPHTVACAAAQGKPIVSGVKYSKKALLHKLIGARRPEMAPWWEVKQADHNNTPTCRILPLWKATFTHMPRPHPAHGPFLKRKPAGCVGTFCNIQ